MADPKSADQAEKEAVERRQAEEPDQQIGHISKTEQKHYDQQWEDGVELAEDLTAEQEARPDDHPVEIAKQERLDQEARVAGESERLQETHGKGASTVEDDRYEGMSADELSGEAERRGLPKSGSKAEILARLKEADQA